MAENDDPSKTRAASEPAVEYVPGLPAPLVDHPRYRVIKLLGEGGMGAVYLAEHRKMERLAALKVINSEYVCDDKAVQRFQKEVRAVSRLSHPNIVTAYDADEAGERDKVHFLVMEYVAGQTLQQRVKTLGPLPPSEASYYIRQVATGLQHAHEKGMVHRDIKPSNLLRTQDGDIKILDFGLARFAQGDDRQTPTLTATGMLAGTPDYMAPEQIESPHSVDIRADVYSLGCTFYQLLSGQVPFPGGNTVDKVLRHTSEVPKPIASLRPGLPAGLAAVVERMMAKDPARRYQSPADVVAALGAITTEDLATVVMNVADFATTRPGGSLVSASLSSEAPPTVLPRETEKAGPTAATRSGRRTTLIVAGALLVAVLASTAFVLSKGTRPNHPPVAQDKAQPSVEGTLKPDPIAVVAPDSPVVAKPDVTPQVGGFREVHGVDAAALQSWMESLQADGYFPTFLSAFAGEGPAKFNALAVPKTRPQRFLFRIGVDAETLLKPSEQEKGSGFHHFIVCPYASPSGTEMVIIDVDGRGLHAHFFGGSPFILNKLKELAEVGHLRPTGLYRSLGPNAGRVYCQLGPNNGHAWEPRLELSAEELRTLVDTQKERDWRPDLLAAYRSGDSTHFMATVVANPAKERWEFRSNLSAAEYEEALRVSFERTGLRPRAVVSFGSASALRYTAVWVPSSPAEPTRGAPKKAAAE